MYFEIDRVFRGDCSTRQVYEDGAKEIALSVVSGINCKYDIVIWLFFFLLFPPTVLLNF